MKQCDGGTPEICFYLFCLFAASVQLKERRQGDGKSFLGCFHLFALISPSLPILLTPILPHPSIHPWDMCFFLGTKQNAIQCCVPLSSICSSTKHHASSPALLECLSLSLSMVLMWSRYHSTSQLVRYQLLHPSLFALIW